MSNPCLSICPLVCILGDSTVSDHKYILGYTKYSRTTSFATAGGHIADQKADWLALDAGVKNSFDYVFVQIGLNDTGSGTIVIEYQDLIDTLKLSVKSGCKIIGITLTPCKAVIPLVNYNNWVAINNAIKGLGATPITGLGGVCYLHTADLSDGNDNLVATYDSGDGLHPNMAGRIINVNRIVELMV